MDRCLPGHYLRPMRFALHLLLIAALAAFAAGAGMSMAGSSDAPSMQAKVTPEQIGMHMADCDDCTAEQMQAGAQLCGSGCVSPAVAVFVIRDLQPVARPVASFPLRNSALAGKIRRPELSPPRYS